MCVSFTVDFWAGECFSGDFRFVDGLLTFFTAVSCRFRQNFTISSITPWAADDRPWNLSKMTERVFTDLLAPVLVRLVAYFHLKFAIFKGQGGRVVYTSTQLL